MISDTLVYIMTAAIVVAAAAIVIQTVLLFAMFLASRAMKSQVSGLIAKVEPMTETGQRLLEEARASFGELSGKAGELLEISRRQLGRVDEVLAEATTRSRTQMDRIEMVVDDTVNRFQETTALLQNGIVKPLKQISGLTIGFRTALSVLLGARRTTVEQATHDEEMFI
jgi:hypothetical protein